jgi:L-ascorbate oxidase
VVYEFDITERDVGTHYYHGHTSLDRGDGLQGPIIITDPNKKRPFEYDEELVLFLQDWYHRPGPSQRTGLDSSPFIWIGNADAFLFNGRGQFADCLNESSTSFLAGNCDANCSAASGGVDSYLPYLQVEAGKTYLLQVINAATLVAVNLAIANHTMTVVGADGTYVKPIEVSSLDMGVAQRYMVLLTTDQPDGSYWMETSIRFRDGGPLGRGYLRYGDSSPPTTSNNSTTPILVHPNVSDASAWFDFEGSLVTLNPDDYNTSFVLTSPVKKQYIVVGTQANDAKTGLLRWAVNNVSETFQARPTLYTALEALGSTEAAPWPDTIVTELYDLPETPPVPFNYTENLLNQSSLITTNIEAAADVVLRLERGDVIEVVMQNALALNGRAEFHSWHMHGHSFWVVGQGNGTFDPKTDPDSFNLKNPLRRDTLSLLPYGWTAIRFAADNPGAWPFHCTLAAHAVMGMGFTILTSPDLLPPPPPGLYSCMETSMNPADAQVCTSASDTTTSSANSSLRLDSSLAWLRFVLMGTTAMAAMAIAA